jgi:hypothetical protein
MEERAQIRCAGGDGTGWRKKATGVDPVGSAPERGPGGERMAADRDKGEKKRRG